MLTTNTKFNFTKAENNVFSWNYFDGDGLLVHKATGRQIYQMHWLSSDGKMSERVVGSDANDVIAFWDELYALKKSRAAELSKEKMASIDEDLMEIEKEQDLIRRMDDPDSDL